MAPPPRGDQIGRVIEGLRADPYSRRHVVSCWDVERLADMALPPCHYSFQLVCRPRPPGPAGDAPGGVDVDCVVTMRSTDVGLGLPFNVVSYTLLTCLLCSAAGAGREQKFYPGELVVNMADCHVYTPHLEKLAEAAAACGEGPPAPRFAFRFPPGVDTVEKFLALSPGERKRILEDSGPPPPRVALKLYV